MGLIRAGVSSVKGTFADQWLETIQPVNLDNTTIMTRGVVVNNKSGSKSSPDVISDGSMVQVGENMMMLLVDGGKIIDFSGEPGYFKVDNQNAPSMFSGDFGGALSDAYNRFKFGGITPYNQQVYYINTQEIQNIPFGTPNAINYFDDFYNAELYLRAHGYYSIKVINPIKFYTEMASKNASRITIDEFRKLYLAEFLTAFQSAIGKMSIEGVRISHISSKSGELAKHMSSILDSDWEERRGIKIVSVGIASISYDDASRELIDIRNKGAMLGNSDIRTGYVQGAAARGVEAAGSNPSGAATGFMGVGMGMGSAGDLVGAATAANQSKQEQPKATDSWKCPKCGDENAGGKFCSNCGEARPAAKFCPECGTKNLPEAKFCSNCGHKF